MEIGKGASKEGDKLGESEGKSTEYNEGSHGVGAAYEILVLRTPVRIWVGPFFASKSYG